MRVWGRCVRIPTGTTLVTGGFTPLQQRQASMCTCGGFCCRAYAGQQACM